MSGSDGENFVWEVVDDNAVEDTKGKKDYGDLI